MPKKVNANKNDGWRTPDWLIERKEEEQEQRMD